MEKPRGKVQEGFFFLEEYVKKRKQVIFPRKGELL